MAPHGRFIKLGLADIQGNVNLLIRSFNSNVSWITIAISYTCNHQPALLAKMLRAITNMIDRGDLKPPTPRHFFSVAQVTNAFQHLQSATSVGKF
jgi:NADPH:quinone reductase-like Zn-dependent oxidoreductase